MSSVQCDVILTPIYPENIKLLILQATFDARHDTQHVAHHVERQRGHVARLSCYVAE